MEHERAQVPSVDHLDRLVARTRRQHLPAPGQPSHPPGVPAGVVVGSDDKGGAYDGQPVAVRRDRGGLAGDLQRPVGLVGDRVDVRAGGRQQLAVLVGIGTGRVGVHRDRRDEHVVAAATTEGGRERPHLPWQVGAGVDGGVPFTIAQHGQVPVAVRGQVPGRGEQVGAGAAPVQQRHVVTVGQRRLDHALADEPRATDDQKSHPPIQARPAGRSCQEDSTEWETGRSSTIGKGHSMSRVHPLRDPCRGRRAVVAFYQAVFGWEVQDWGDFAGMPYFGVITGAEDQPGINGAIMQRQGANPAAGSAVAGAVLTMGSGDFDATAAKIAEAGGTVALPKHALTGMAWQGYFLDTEGNVFGVHQPDPEALVAGTGGLSVLGAGLIP